MTTLFIDNKYTKWYNSIIDKARDRETPVLYETHHIIPRAAYKCGLIEGNMNEPSNLVDLTLEEHYLCHVLLIKAVKSLKLKKKMLHALTMMVKTRENQHLKFNRHLYAKLKKLHRSLPKQTIYYNAELNKQIKLFDDEIVPDGYVKGGKPKPPGFGAKLSKIKLADPNTKIAAQKRGEKQKGKSFYMNEDTGEYTFAHKETLPPGNWIKRGPTKGRTYGEYYHNPITKENRIFNDSGDVPPGWIHGKYFSEETVEKFRCNVIKSIQTKESIEKSKNTKITKQNRAYYNPETLEELHFGVNDTIPDGWIKGRSPKNIKTGWKQTDKQRNKVSEVMSNNYEVEFDNGNKMVFTSTKKMMDYFSTNTGEFFNSFINGTSKEKYGLIACNTIKKRGW